MSPAPLSVTDLARITGISRATVYREIGRGCLSAAYGPGGSWGRDEHVPQVELAEGYRWAAAFTRYSRDHDRHRR